MVAILCLLEMMKGLINNLMKILEENISSPLKDCEGVHHLSLVCIIFYVNVCNCPSKEQRNINTA